MRRIATVLLIILPLIVIACSSNSEPSTEQTPPRETTTGATSYQGNAKPFTPAQTKATNPPLNVNIDYIGVKYDHDPLVRGPGDIRLIVLISDGAKTVDVIMPSADMEYPLNDYETVRINQCVFSTSSVGNYLEVSIIAYEDDDNIISKMLLDNLPTLLSTFVSPGAGDLLTAYQQLTGKPLFQDTNDYVGSFEGYWSPNQSWGIGQYNCVGTDDFRLWMSIWSNTKPSIIPKPAMLPSTVFNGWYANGTQVNSTIKGNTVTAKLSLSSGEPGQYEMRIGRDVSLGFDETVKNSLFSYDGTNAVKELSFVPPYGQGENGTTGYWVQIYKDGTQVSTIPDTYPPRLIVTVPVPTPLTIKFNGWYVNGTPVNYTAKGSTVMAMFSLSGGESGQYEIRIGRDISWASDETIKTTFFTYNGTSGVGQLSFVPSYRQGENSTNGYWVELYRNGVQISNLQDTYPPRLRVN